MKKLFLIGAAAVLLAGCTNNVTVTNNDSNQDNSSTKQYTLAEVESHSTRDNCWLIINNKVYDVTKYINMHPGGAEILKGCGKDATELFATQGGKGAHSNSATRLIENYYIGDLKK